MSLILFLGFQEANEQNRCGYCFFLKNPVYLFYYISVYLPTLLLFILFIFLVAEKLNNHRCLSVTSVCNTFFQIRFLSKRPSSYCLIHFGGSSGAAQGQLGGGRRPLMENDKRQHRHRQYSTGTARDDSWPPTETETFCQNSILMHKILS